ncbi:MAG TPA: hypothetical protein VHY19_01600 [Steroidobacteraceae bacterium]|jgi:hypothetical protein|nr:hypothetical protein [Steroidobacteraceae bacterium]
MRIRSLLQAALGCVAGCLWAAAALAQVDLSGNWAAESMEDPVEHTDGGFPDMFAGIPLNEEGRQAGLTAPGNEAQELNRQCEPWPAHYLVEGPWGGRFAAVRDQAGHVIAWTLSSPAYDRLPMTIWMDGRPVPPPRSLHTYAGYSVGRWRGDTLVVSTSLLKDSYLLDNGVPSSNRENDTFFLTRYGDELTVLLVVRDPVYLQAPLVQGRTLRLVSSGSVVDDPILYCMPAETLAGFTDGYHSAIELPAQEAHQQTYLQGIYRLPLEATLGGAQTMYPQFEKQLRGKYQPPAKCSLYCGREEVLPIPAAIQTR